MKLERALAAKLTQAGQQALIDHCESLDDVAAADLVAQLETIDFDLVARLREEGVPGPPAHQRIEPIPYVPLAERGAKAQWGAWAAHPDPRSPACGRDRAEGSKSVSTLPTMA